MKVQHNDDKNLIGLKHSGTVHKNVYLYLKKGSASVKATKKESVHKISVHRICVQTKYKYKMLQSSDFKAIFNIAISRQNSMEKKGNE